MLKLSRLLNTLTEPDACYGITTMSPEKTSMPTVESPHLIAGPPDGPTRTRIDSAGLLVPYVEADGSHAVNRNTSPVNIVVV